MKHLYLALVFCCSILNAQECGSYTSCEMGNDFSSYCNINFLDTVTCWLPTLPNTDFPKATLCQEDTSGIPHNVIFYSFFSNDTFFHVEIRAGIDSCRSVSEVTGMQAGVFYSECQFSHLDTFYEVDANCRCEGQSRIELKGKIEPRKRYILWVDGCNGDICSYEINVIRKAPELPDLPAVLPSPETNDACYVGDTLKLWMHDSIHCYGDHYWGLPGDSRITSDTLTLVLGVDSIRVEYLHLRGWGECGFLRGTWKYAGKQISTSVVDANVPLMIAAPNPDYGGVRLQNAHGEIVIHDKAGNEVHRTHASGSLFVPLPSGVYFVRGKQVLKAVVR